MRCQAAVARWSSRGWGLHLRTQHLPSRYVNHCFLGPPRHLSKNFPGSRAGRGGAGSGPLGPAPYRDPPTTQDAGRGWRRKVASGLAIGSNPARREDGLHRSNGGGGEEGGAAGELEVSRREGEGAGSRVLGVRMRAQGRSGWAERGGGDGGRGGVVISAVRTA